MYVGFEGWGNLDYLLNLIVQFPDSAFHAHVFPFGKVTVLTSRKLIDEMNHTSPNDLSFDEVSREVCHMEMISNLVPLDSMRMQLIQPDHTVFGQASRHHPISVIQQNFNRRLGSLVPEMFNDIKTAVDGALEHTERGCIVAGLH